MNRVAVFGNVGGGKSTAPRGETFLASYSYRMRRLIN